MNNYYDQIKTKLIDNEIYEKVKDYSKERNRIIAYYEVGKLLSEAGKHYGEGIIKKFSEKLVNELGKKYTERYLFDMKRLYSFSKVHPLDAHLSLSHYRILFAIKNDMEIEYYITQIKSRNLSKRELQEIIKNKEYERLSEETKKKLTLKENIKLEDTIKNPIIIRNKNNYKEITEKVLQRIILEDIDIFLKELGNGFSYIASEYKIKIGDRYNYIDFLLYNIKYKCYTVLELKITELKKLEIVLLRKLIWKAYIYLLQLNFWVLLHLIQMSY